MFVRIRVIGGVGAGPVRPPGLLVQQHGLSYLQKEIKAWIARLANRGRLSQFSMLPLSLCLLMLNVWEKKIQSIHITIFL